MDGRAACIIDNQHLAEVDMGTGPFQHGNCLTCAGAVGQQVQPAAAEGGIGDVLTGDRTNTGAGIGATGSNCR